MDQSSVKKLQEVIGYSFKDEELLKNASKVLKEKFLMFTRIFPNSRFVWFLCEIFKVRFFIPLG